MDKRKNSKVKGAITKEVPRDLLLKVEEQINTLNSKRNNPDITYMKIIMNIH